MFIGVASLSFRSEKVYEGSGLDVNRVPDCPSHSNVKSPFFGNQELNLILQNSALDFISTVSRLIGKPIVF